MSLPVRVRLTLWYGSLLEAMLVGLGAFLIVRLRADLVAAIDRSLDTRAAQIALNYTGDGEEEFRGVSESSLVAVPRGETADQVLSPSGTVLQSAGDEAVSQEPMIGAADLARARRDGAGLRLTAALGADREPFRILAVRLPDRPDVLVVSESLEDVDRSVHRLLGLMLLAGPAALAAAGGGGWWIAGEALRPVRRMTEEAAAIGPGRLHERVGVPRTRDEIERLGMTLNAMLARLERSVDEQRRFVADAAHELRTPLAIMRSEIDVSLASDRLPPAARAVLRSAADEVGRMSGIVENLLTLARMDEEGGLEILRAPVDLADVALDVARRFQAAAGSKGIVLGVSAEHVVVLGDRERLLQAVANLVDNAVKYTQPGGHVEVSVRAAPGRGRVVVADDGPGIPPELLPRIFDRFVRADAVRSRGTGGAGLGLAICRGIVEAHGGRIRAESEPGEGSRFVLELPVVEDAGPVDPAGPTGTMRVR